LKPEKITEVEVLAMCNRLGFDVSVIESKATYSKNLERYTKSKSAPVGISDIVGNDDRGMAVYVELKAKGKLSTLRPAQKIFLLRKIQSGCFAVVVDSADLLFDLYSQWRKDPQKFLSEYPSNF
jgi:hypothetical protein